MKVRSSEVIILHLNSFVVYLLKGIGQIQCQGFFTLKTK
jgi:hypothetical protein